MDCHSSNPDVIAGLLCFTDDKIRGLQPVFGETLRKQWYNEERLMDKQNHQHSGGGVS